MKDRANFFKLPDSDRKQLQEDGEICIDNKGNIAKTGSKLKKYMEDLPPSAYGYVRNIERDIEEQKGCPYVMSIEAEYGSGKTHFVTRLCQYLTDNKINAIYFSAFEYENIDPKLAILYAISKGSGVFKNLFQFFEELLSKIHATFGVSFNIPCGPSIHLELSKIKIKAEIQQLKKKIQESIVEHGGLVLIIDELDRCDPRFCVNLLEVLKHFFDLDGIFIILSFNEKALLSALTKIYGLDSKADQFDSYIEKFINHRTRLYKIDIDICAKIVADSFKENNYCVEEPRIHEIATVFMEKNFTLRETISCIGRIMSLIKEYDLSDLLLYTHVSTRYCEYLNKMTDTKSQCEFNVEKLEEKWTIMCNYPMANIKNIRTIITKEFGVKDYSKYLRITKLQEDIINYYQILCKDSGNARKFAEFFIEELLKRIDSLLKQHPMKNISYLEDGITHDWD